MRTGFILTLLVTFLIASSANAQKAKLIAYWSFDDGTANDFSGNGYHGTLMNNPKADIGIKGLGMRFMGRGINSAEGDHILLPKIDFGKYPEFTITMWVKEDSVTHPAGEAYIFFGEHANGWLGIYNHCQQYPDYNENIKYISYSVGSIDWNSSLMYRNDSINQSTWVSYSIVFKSNHFWAYRNGILIGEKDQKINISASYAALARHWWASGAETSSRFCGMIDEVKIFDKAMTPKEIDDMETDTVSCHPNSFEYKSLADASNLKLLGMANVTNNSVELTNLHQFASGAIWYDKKVPVKKGFSTEFSFFLSNGTNNDVVESTLPGADGIALVIQNSGTNRLGFAGGGIGYEGIKNGVAVEIDSYINKERNDPENDHVGLMTCGVNGEISSDHGSKTCLGTANLANPVLNAVHDKYFCKVVYSEPIHQLTVYLDKTGEFKSPVMIVDNFDITKYMTLANDEFAYIGITSATGSAAERHWVSSWKACFKNTSTVLSNHDEIGTIADNELKIVPNPAEGAVSIRFMSAPGEEYQLNIYDILGNNVFSSNLRASTELSCISWNPANSMARGVYNCVVSSGNRVLSVPMVIK